MRGIIGAAATAATVIFTACSQPAPEPAAERAAPAEPTSQATDTTDDRRTVVFVGTSLTAGYGVGDDVAYPAVIQERIDSAGLPYRVVNAGISGETSAGALRRMEWTLQQPVDVLVLEMGANDGLRGQDPARMRQNMDSILTLARSRYPDVRIVLVGMEAPPNLGDDYTSRFRAVYAELAAKHRAELVPFLLQGVAGMPALNTDDGIHPNEQGHRIIAATVWPVLEPVLRR